MHEAPVTVGLERVKCMQPYLGEAVFRFQTCDFPIHVSNL